jgi:hypothetical protein
LQYIARLNGKWALHREILNFKTFSWAKVELAEQQRAGADVLYLDL